MARIKLVVSYDGSSFHGWQKQINQPLTIQHQLELALSKIFDRSMSIIGAGRTDAGVHAKAQVAHCDIPVEPISSLIKSINALTPPSIACHQLWKTPPKFHAQISATERTYSYFIFNTRTAPVINRNFTLWYPYPIQIQKLNQMAQQILGTHDFKSFQNSGSSPKDTMRTMKKATWFWMKPGLLVFRVCGQSFLKQMVRNLVGSQLQWMKDKNAVQKFQQTLRFKDRKYAGKTAPAHGLFLDSISYPYSLDRKCQKL